MSYFLLNELNNQDINTKQDMDAKIKYKLRVMFNNKNILVTGGTGSFGKAFIKKILKLYNPKKL